jgi:hypothetical protein
MLIYEEVKTSSFLLFLLITVYSYSKLSSNLEQEPLPASDEGARMYLI